jgi:hypothetical protein
MACGGKTAQPSASAATASTLSVTDFMLISLHRPDPAA